MKPGLLYQLVVRQGVGRPLAAFFLLAAAVLLYLHGPDLRPERWEAWFQARGLWGRLVFVAACGVAAVLLTPAALMNLSAGALFGPLSGALLGLAGTALGAGCAFLVSRHLAADWAERRLGARLSAVKRGVEAEGWRFVAFVRLVPFFPYNLLNYAFGLTRLRASAFVLTSAVFMAPASLVWAGIGHAGRQAVAGNNDPTHALFALGLLAMAVYLPGLVRRWRGV